MKAIVSIFCLILSLQLYGQSPQWHEGSLVLKNNHVLQGKLAVQPAHDMILFRTKDRMKVYTADKITAAYFYDEATNVNRKYISLDESEYSFSASYLYEVVLFGEVRLVRRLSNNAGMDHAQAYRYFVLVGKELVSLKKFRTKVYPDLLSRSEGLFTFINKYDLNPNNSADIVRIIDYYNQESRMTSMLAVSVRD